MRKPDDDAEANVRGEEYFVAHRRAPCSSCGGLCLLVGVAAQAGHDRLDGGEDSPDESGRGMIWESAAYPAFLFYLGFLSDAMQARLQNIAPCYRFSDDPRTGDAYWANHCEHCGARIDDAALYCEPGGGFMPMSPDEASAVSLVRVRERFAVAAAGYSGEPELFFFMPTS